MKLSKNHLKILQAYSRLAQKLGVYPSRADMADIGFNRDKIRHYFGSLLSLREAAKKANPSSFKGILDEILFSPERISQLKTETKKYKRFVITTAIGGATLHQGFYKSIKTYCQENDALLLVLLASDPASRQGAKFNISKELLNEFIVTKDVALNSNIFVSTIKLSAKHIDPITSLTRIGQRNGSFIYASPKQRMKPTPNSATKMPHVVMTTGAITKPGYETDRYMSERTAYIATNDHVMGAIVVEIEDDNFYHYRQIQAEPRTGYFVDLGRYYCGADIKTMKPAAFVLGDYHSGQTDQTARAAWHEVLNEVGADKLIFHDLFDGLSINHHDRLKQITLAGRFAAGLTNLSEEISGVARDINEYLPKVKQVVVVRSNHDDFLDRYLQDGLYTKDPQNYGIALELAAAMLRKQNPLQYGVERVGLSDPKRVKWLSRDEDFKIARIECGAHGDKGANGAKGSIRAMENAYGNSVSGHEHTPQILRGAWIVGTTSLLKQDYNSGPSSWMHTSCLVYENGSRQLINSINGKWRLKD